MQCREELAQFVRVMEGKLCATDYKKHWRSAFATGEIDFAWLIGRLEDEVRELSASGVGCASPHAIAAECADIANFAMMIADLAMRGEIE